MTLVRTDSIMPPRVAYAIGKRVGSAVERNRVRRRLRTCVHQHVESLVAGGSYLLSVGPAAVSMSYTELSGYVGSALSAVRDAR